MKVRFWTIIPFLLITIYQYIYIGFLEGNNIVTRGMYSLLLIVGVFTFIIKPEFRVPYLLYGFTGACLGMVFVTYPYTQMKIFGTIILLCGLIYFVFDFKIKQTHNRLS